MVGRTGWFRAIFVNRSCRCRDSKGGLQRQGFVKRDSQGIDIGAMIDAPARRSLLGAHVPNRANHVAGHGQLRILLDASQTEVGDPQFVARVQQQVCRA